MHGDLKSGDWQDLNGESSEGVSSDYGNRGAVMDPIKAVCYLTWALSGKRINPPACIYSIQFSRVIHYLAGSSIS